jgi:hypothetical protein
MVMTHEDVFNLSGALVPANYKSKTKIESVISSILFWYMRNRWTSCVPVGKKPLNLPYMRFTLHKVRYDGIPHNDAVTRYRRTFVSVFGENRLS